MRVLHLATTYPLHERDSNAAFVREIAEGIAARGHVSDVVVPWHPELVTDRPASPLTLHAFRYSPLRAWHPWGYAQALHADRRLRVDAYVAAVPAAWTSRRALIRMLSSDSYDIVHAHWLLPNGPIAASAIRAARASARLVISCHGSGVFLSERFGWASRLAAYGCRHAAAVTACSADLASRTAATAGVAHVERIPYGVHTQRFVPQPHAARAALRERLAPLFGAPVEGRWILAVGRLVFKKGFAVLLEALRTLRATHADAHVIIVGSGPLLGALREQARRLGVEAFVHFPGAVAHADLPDAYAAADVVAVPSVHDTTGNVDGLPNTFLEALSCAAPVVASRIAGIPDIVDHERQALLVEEGDVDGLARAMDRLLADRDLSERLGSAARALAMERLDWSHIVTRFEAVYSAALDD